MFHNSNVFGSCIIRILYTGCAKIKKKSVAKRLIKIFRKQYQLTYNDVSKVVIFVTTSRWMKGKGMALSPELTRMRGEVRIHVPVVCNFVTEEPWNFPHAALIFTQRIIINFAALSTNLCDHRC